MQAGFQSKKVRGLKPTGSACVYQAYMPRRTKAQSIAQLPYVGYAVSRKHKMHAQFLTFVANVNEKLQIDRNHGAVNLCTVYSD